MQNFTIRGVHLAVKGCSITAQEAEEYVSRAQSLHPSIRYISALTDEHQVFLEYNVSPSPALLSDILARKQPYISKPIDYDSILQEGVSYDK